MREPPQAYGQYGRSPKNKGDEDGEDWLQWVAGRNILMEVRDWNLFGTARSAT